MKDFIETKSIFKKAIKAILEKESNPALDEAALPAYAHSNPIIDHIFWQRIKIAYTYALKLKPVKILDFGCGVGLLSYALAKKGFQVTALDLDFTPLNQIRKSIDFPGLIDFIEDDLLRLKFEHQSFDFILALDVLEHIENFDDYILEFSKILKPTGCILVCGPTENKLYKLGRNLAGKKFTGDYHKSNIGEIRNQFSKHMKVKTIRKLIWPFTLFEIFVAFPNQP